MALYGLQLRSNFRRPGVCYRVRCWPFFPPGALRALMFWFELNRRPFPWREAHVSPWARLVAEMLLRQTAARKVAEVWPALLERYPDPVAMAGAEPPELEAVVRPLGLAKQRSQALLEAARHLLARHGGEVPASELELLAIPHVGPYTAYAVQAFTHGIPAPLVDVNILRIFDRYFGLGTRTLNPHREEHIWKRARRVVPLERVAEFHLALLDLAALVCKAGRPACEVCPMRRGCRGSR